MFGFNWTKAGQGDDQGSRHADRYGLFGMTALAFGVFYAAAGLLVVLLVMRNLSEAWPILLIMATPFIVTTGLTGWLMATAALAICPIRLAAAWLRCLYKEN